MQISPQPTHPPMYDRLLTLYGQASHKFSVTYGIYAGLIMDGVFQYGAPVVKELFYSVVLRRKTYSRNLSSGISNTIPVYLFKFFAILSQRSYCKKIDFTTFWTLCVVNRSIEDQKKVMTGCIHTFSL